jgi:hypothetical protein
MTNRRSLSLLATGLLALALPVLPACSAADDARSDEAVGTTDQDLYGLGSLAQVWPNGVVPVCFQSLTSHPDLQADIPAILGYSWSTVANITFTGFGACAASGNQVTIAFSTASDFRGLTNSLGDGTPTVTLVSDDSPDMTHFKYEVIHEMGHALGFAHEMQRPDNWDGGTYFNCGVSTTNSDYPNYKSSPGGLYLTTSYDEYSVMNYSGSGPGCNPIGYPTSLSAGDVSGVRSASAYGPSKLSVPATSPTPKCSYAASTSSIGAIYAECTPDSASDPIYVFSRTSSSAPWTYAYDYEIPYGPVGGQKMVSNAAPGSTTYYLACTQSTSDTYFPSRTPNEGIVVPGIAGCDVAVEAVTVPTPPPCVPLTASSCSASQCGSSIPNGCGGTVECAVCECGPALCEAAGANCGTVGTCGSSLSCGTCPSEESCQSNVCTLIVKIPPPPPPRCGKLAC